MQRTTGSAVPSCICTCAPEQRRKHAMHLILRGRVHRRLWAEPQAAARTAGAAALPGLTHERREQVMARNGMRG